MSGTFSIKGLDSFVCLNKEKKKTKNKSIEEGLCIFNGVCLFEKEVAALFCLQFISSFIKEVFV